jgi:uncharacterized membrane-anchored protein
MLKFIRSALSAALLLVAISAMAPAEPFSDAFPEVYSQVDDATRSMLDRIDIKTGTVSLGSDIATVALPDGYYFLDPASSEVVLTELWGNPPGASMLGMVFPREASPLHDTWGVTIEFDPMGYVSDEDAGQIDYDDLLATMQSDTLAANPERRKAGYPAVTLAGWAEPPHYIASERALYWAKDLVFEGEAEHTLNYNIRKLGRKGVLVVTFVAGMGQLGAVSRAAPDILQMVSFTEGNRYADFIPGTDTVAAVGLGGLIAGKVLAKAGLLVAILAFLKKGGVLIVLPVLWLIRKLRSAPPAA